MHFHLTAIDKQGKEWLVWYMSWEDAPQYGGPGYKFIIIQPQRSDRKFYLFEDPSIEDTCIIKEESTMKQNYIDEWIGG